MGVLGLKVRSATAPETPEGVRPPARDDLSERGLLSTINVYRAIALLSLGTSQFTMDVWRGTDQVDRPALVRRPDINAPANQGRFRPFVKRSTASLACTGNAYWEITPGDRGPVSLKVLNPHECTPLKDGTLGVSGRDKPLPPERFRHLGLLWIPGELKALGPIQAARMELTGQVKVTRYGSEFFDTGDVPTGLLKTDQPLTPSDAGKYKKLWQERKAHEVAVLGQGLDYKPFLLSPEDAQFVATRQFDTTATARLFGLPARLFLAVVEGGADSYANLSQDDLGFVRWGLSDYLGEIEEAYSSVLPGIQEARFNLDGGLRPDTKTRYEAHQLAINAGWKLRSEVRADEGLTPIPGIDDKPMPATSAAPTQGAQK